jgi:hypothetical protein
MHAPSLDHARRWLDLSADEFDPAAARPSQGTVGRWWITSLPVARRSAGSCQRSGEQATILANAVATIVADEETTTAT